ncbi:MAG: sialate O-acetylesterase [Gammaproteobacteria bacterium]|nr:sialate O-acetylesterase [Gammaproteobacteria bacterium]
MSQVNRIWIIAGQSWAAGQTGTMTDLQAAYKSQYLHNSRIWLTNRFEPLYSTDNNNQYPTSTKNTGCSVEFYFKDIADYLGDDVYILKYAEGSTRLELDGARTDWNTGSTSELYDDLVAEIALVETWMTDRGKTFQWEGIIWWQGEGDCVPESASLAYGTNMTDLYNGLNTATGTTLKCYHYNIEEPPSENREFLTNVNTGKATFNAGDATNRTLYDTDIIEWNVDDIHPSVDGYKDLWDRVQKDLIIADL